jgi:ligand-binding SRPBCC domain-containing protein
MEHTHAFTAGTKQTFILAMRLRSSSLNSALDMEADFGKRQKAVVLQRMWLFKAQVTGSS